MTHITIKLLDHIAKEPVTISQFDGILSELKVNRIIADPNCSEPFFSK